jgi:hypothetical protein
MLLKALFPFSEFTLLSFNFKFYWKTFTIIKFILITFSLVQGPNGHNYTLVNFTTTWIGAKNEAISMSGYLASITSAEEQQFILDSFSSFDFWIGGADVYRTNSLILPLSLKLIWVQKKQIVVLTFHLSTQQVELGCMRGN